MKCVFLGSPEFAVASLEALLASTHQVVGVITQPDRPAGRGLKLEPPAVKVVAQKHGIPLLQPEKVNSEETYAFLEKLQPEILAVVAYGEFLGSRLLAPRPHPPVNVHPSLLPDLRGAAPMQWALLRGYSRTGVSTQVMVKEMDAGDILLQVETPLGPNENSRELQERLKKVGGDLLVKTLTGLEAGTIQPKPQDSSKATLAPLLTKELGLLHFSQESAQGLHNKVRGLFPWPGAHCYHGGKRVKILRTLVSDEPARGSAGDFWFQGSRLFVSCSAGTLEILELQPEGKRPVLPQEFENGIKNMPLHFTSEIKS